MIGKKLDKIEESDLQDLMDNEVQEGKTIEYKASLNLDSEKQKAELLKNVSSFANASGGDLIYGIKEGSGKKKGIPDEIKGMPIESTDIWKQRIESILLRGITPRLHSKNIHFVELNNKNIALVIRVGKSWIGPHRVVFKDDPKFHEKFFTRNSSGIHSMDVSELRVAFNLSDTIIEKVRKFKDGRILNIIADETPFPLTDGPKIVFHLIPLISFNPGQRYDIVALIEKMQPLPLIVRHTHNGRFNLDGYLSFPEVSDGTLLYSYTQFFRNGIIEGVESSLFDRKSSRINNRYEGNIIDFLKKCLNILNELNVEPPFMVFLTLVGVKGYEIIYKPLNNSPKEMILSKQLSHEREPFKIDRNELIIPEVLLEGFDDDPTKALKDIFDIVWNACNYKHSYNYDENGGSKIKL